MLGSSILVKVLQLWIAVQMFKYVLSIRKCELSTSPKLVSSCTTTSHNHCYTPELLWRLINNPILCTRLNDDCYLENKQFEYQNFVLTWSHQEFDWALWTGEAPVFCCSESVKAWRILLKKKEFEEYIYNLGFLWKILAASYFGYCHHQHHFYSQM